MIREIMWDSKGLPEAFELVWQTFLLFEAPDYSEEGVQEFKGFIAVENIRESLKKKELILWGFYEETELQGVIAVRDGCHISLLFVEKQHHYKGIARQLLSGAVAYCSANADCQRITVNSSPYAEAAYRKLGFVPEEEEQTVNGIRFIPMMYTIA